MTPIKILQYPDPRLARKGIPVEKFDDSLQQFIDAMFATHYATANCAALAATQMDVPIPWCLTVIDFSPNKDQPLCLVNPKIIHREGEQIELEGCMSVFPDFVHEKVKRAHKIVVQAQDRYGNPLEITAEGYLAKCIQHELDHLNGLLYVDLLPQFKKERIARKIKKYQRLKSKNA